MILLIPGYNYVANAFQYDNYTTYVHMAENIPTQICTF